MNALLVGRWLFVAMIYQGQRLPPRDPALQLSYEIRADGTDRLAWNYGPGRESCAREGRWNDADPYLEDEVQSVDPANSSTCGNDPDMAPGNHTLTRYDFASDELRLHFGFSSEELLYVWQRQP